MTTLTASALLPVYAQMPVQPVSGQGSWLVDERGQRWLDAYGGHAVAATGHSHPHVVRAISDQAAQLLFYSTAVPLPVRERLAEGLVRRCPVAEGQVFFCNSGAEANENALHLARRATGRKGVITLAGGWHGRTVATLACCDGEHYEAGAIRAGYQLSRRVPFDDLAALDRAVDDSIAAILVEPVQGMAGARPCAPEWLEAARRLSAERGAVLVFDEVQCGAGRTGHYTAAEHFGVTPDIITMAKGLASGLPIGAVLARPAVTAGLKTGDLGSTFGGGPLPCAAALATLEVLDQEDVLGNVRRVEDYIRGRARAMSLPVQGAGLLLGLRVPGGARALQQALFERRILTGTSSDPAVLRLLPPLTFSLDEAAQLMDAIAAVRRGAGL